MAMMELGCMIIGMFLVLLGAWSGIVDQEYLKGIFYVILGIALNRWCA